MKTSIKSIATAIVLPCVFAGQGFAMTTQLEVADAIRAVVGGDTNVSVFVQGDTVTLTGSFGDAGDQYNAINAALALDGINKVQDHTFGSL